MTRVGKPSGSPLPISGLLALGLAACGGQGTSSAGAAANVAFSGSGVTVDVLATQSWSGGFNGAVRITDTAFASPITSFEVVFQLTGNAQVSGTGWNGTISAPDASGNRTVRSPDWLQYQPIRVGRTWDVGFSASGTFSGSTIVSVKINGQPLAGGDLPPTLSLASSAAAVVAPGSFTLTGTVSDDHGVTKVEFYEGTTLLASDTTAPYAQVISTTTASVGTHLYTAKAYDTINQVTTSNSVTVVVKSPADLPPTVSLASSATNVITASTITLTATASDDHGVTKVEFYDGTTLLGTDTTAPYTQGVAFTGANNGAHVMTAKAYDTVNPATTSTAVNVSVNIPDTTPPSAPTNLAASNLTSTSVMICWTASTDDRGVVSYDVTLNAGLVATVTSTCVSLTGLTPNTSYTVAIRARDAASNLSPSATLAFTTPPAVTADVTLTVNTSSSRRAISPYVYGYNASRLADSPPGATYLRIGGNRWTAYNWTNNSSNAGSDWGPYSNDTYMGTPTQGPGAAITPTIDDARASGIAALVTIPIQGYVSQAKVGNVPLTDPVSSWFVPNAPAKGSAFTLTPSPSSTTVYQDELANFVANRWGAATAPHLSLDNEPDLWGYVDANGAAQGTHPEVQRTQLTYAVFLQRSIASATAIKAAVPGALVYGPVSYGWNGMLSFQGAPDSTGATIDNSFLDYYLTNMSSASASRRLLDVLDVHWYSEATSSGCANSGDSGIRVTTANNTDCVVAARVQAPRSLFDPTFVETSWITQWTTASSAMGQGIQLVPRLLAKISSRYPGTKLAVTEYNHGGEDHVSGAVAQADTLGIFGREGVYAAAFWSINTNHAWTYAAWKAFRNYDGSGHSFGDTSVSASTTDVAHVSVYASVDAATPNRLVLVIVHRPTLGSTGTLDLKSRTVQVNWTHSQTLRTVRAWQLASASSPTWQTVSVPAPSSNTLTMTVPAYSVTTVELTP